MCFSPFQNSEKGLLEDQINEFFTYSPVNLKLRGKVFTFHDSIGYLVSAAEVKCIPCMKLNVLFLVVW